MKSALLSKRIEDLKKHIFIEKAFIEGFVSELSGIFKSRYEDLDIEHIGAVCQSIQNCKDNITTFQSKLKFLEEVAAEVGA